MHRRKFIGSIAWAAALTCSLVRCRSTQQEIGLLEQFIRMNDESVERILFRQQLDKQHPFYGGFPDKFDIYHHSSPAGYSKSLVMAYLSKSSRYHESEDLALALSLAMDYLLSVQNEYGNIDLLTTNFNSPPDTAFAVEPVSVALTLIKKLSSDKLLDFQNKAAQFLKKAGEGLVVGGIHTPNHRWVVCRALARIHTLFPDPKYLNRIDQWLAEGIDIDPDGQYTEKSIHYSPLVDDCFITMARLLNKPELYAPVRKNLDMIKYFVHANGEVVTEVSTRQDQYKIEDLKRFYFAYRYMALLDNDEQFSTMANYIEESVGLEKLSFNLSHFLELESIHADFPIGAELPANYVKNFSHSKLVRIRRGEVDASILGDNFSFFTFFKGEAALQGVRLASAFFGKGQFISEELVVDNGKYILTQELEGPYYQPHHREDISPDGDWEKMPRSERKQSEIQYLKSVIVITELDGNFNIHFNISGTPRVPLAIELNFREGGILNGVRDLGEDRYLLTDQGTYSKGSSTIKFGPAKSDHSWTQLRGAESKLKGMSVYLTGYSPFDLQLDIS